MAEAKKIKFGKSNSSKEEGTIQVVYNDYSIRS